jgi:uncharacterized protein (DUF58 family)
MLTRAAHGLLLVATTLLVFGLGTANPLVLGLAAIPLTTALVGLAEPTARVTSARIDVPERARAGDVVEIRVHLETEGSGLLAVSVPLPGPFALAEGTNAVLLDADEPRQEHTFAFKVDVAKRGEHDVGPVQAAPVPRHGLRSREVRPVGDSAPIHVRPGLIPLRRLRRLRGTAASVGAEEDAARMGLKTTDFREIREYRHGDPPKAVNWKATARLGPAADRPLVNEYEVEGRQAVWFMLDAGRHMAVGTSVENGFEAALSAASGLSLAYLDRGYRVGLHAYNTPGEPLYPDVGDKQFYKLQRHLARLRPGEADEGPLEAVLASRSWLTQHNPMVVFLTRTDVATGDLEAAVQRLNAMAGQRPRPIVVIEPLAHHLVDDDPVAEPVARLLDHQARARHETLRRAGARVVPWNPREEPLERLLFEGVATRG